MATNDFIPFAINVAANVDTQANYLASMTGGYGDTGFQSGLAQSVQLNKVWRQAAFMAAVLAQWMMEKSTQDVLDDGNQAGKVALLTTALQAWGDARYVNVSDYSFLPVGTLVAFAHGATPNGFLLCPTAQTNISRTTYAALFAALNTLWGVGDGSTTFGMPWFPANYAMIQQLAGNIGSSSVGEVISHSHVGPSYLYGSVAGYHFGTAGGNFDQSLNFSNYSWQSTGGAANLAAGSRVQFAVKY